MSMENSSDVGSPMAGATDPASFRRMSDLGTPNAGTAPSGMVPLDESQAQPQQKLADVKPFKQQQQMVDLDTADEAVDEPDASDEMQMLEEETGPPAEDGALTPEQAAAKYAEWNDSPDVPEEFMDKVMWFDSDGKGTMVPMRLRDLPDNILMYRDYQKKTAEVANQRRQVDRLINGQRMMANDIKSGDPNLGLRAWRYMGGEKTLEAMVIQYVRDRAELEKLPPHYQQRFLEQQKRDDEYYYLTKQNAELQRQLDAQAQQEQQAQGVNAPDIVHVQQHILNTLPSVYQELKLAPAEVQDDLFVWHLEQTFERAAAGERGPDGQWSVPPTIQRGKTPSTRLIKQLVLEAKRATDIAKRGSKRVGPQPKKTPPPTLRAGTGPAAKPGQRGNMGQPQRLRWSDMGKNK